MRSQRQNRSRRNSRRKTRLLKSRRHPRRRMSGGSHDVSNALKVLQREYTKYMSNLRTMCPRFSVNFPATEIEAFITKHKGDRSQMLAAVKRPPKQTWKGKGGGKGKGKGGCHRGGGSTDPPGIPSTDISDAVTGLTGTGQLAIILGIGTMMALQASDASPDTFISFACFVVAYLGALVIDSETPSQGLG